MKKMKKMKKEKKNVLKKGSKTWPSMKLQFMHLLSRPQRQWFGSI